MLDFFIAKQPIFTADNVVFGYELLFRNSLKNVYPDICPNEATKKLIDGAFLAGHKMRELNGKRAFVNFTEQSILDGHPFLIPPDSLVVEILETATPSENLLNACIKLKKKGYMLALDDFEYSSAWNKFFPYIDIIKVDLSTSSDESIIQLGFATRSYPKMKLLAERVETLAQFNRFKSIGFHYFQGYFFAKPEVTQQKILSARQNTVLHLMQQVSSEDYDINDVSSIISRDVDMACRLLTYVNSSIYLRPKRIESVKNALITLGKKGVLRFVSILFILEKDTSKSDELTLLALTRAFFCDAIAQKTQPDLRDQAFLSGLLSLIDSMFNQNMDDILDRLPLVDDIKSALRGGNCALSHWLKLTSAYEVGNWERVNRIGAHYELNDIDLIECQHLSSTFALEQLNAP